MLLGQIILKEIKILKFYNNNWISQKVETFKLDIEKKKVRISRFPYFQIIVFS